MRRILHFVLSLLVTFLGAEVNGQVINTVVGNGTAGYITDPGLAVSTEIDSVIGITVDVSGNLIIADNKNNRVRLVTPCGTISTIAGTGVGNFTGGGGVATSAHVFNPTGVTTDASGNIYLCDAGNNKIRKITTTGTISVLCGGISGNGGDGGAATAATITTPMGIVVNTSGDIIFSDINKNRLRRITSAGIIVNFAGPTNGSSGSTDGVATAAKFSLPSGLAIDAAGNVYVADAGNNEIRMVTPSGVVSTIAGTGTIGSSGDGGPATAALLNNPSGVYVDALYNIYIADQGNNKIRVISPSGTIATFAGNGTAGFLGDNGLATSASLNLPYAIVGRSDGSLYVSDYGNNRIRKIFTNHKPIFKGGNRDSLSLCTSTNISISSYLTVHDTDAGQNLTWGIAANAHHGTVVASFSATTAGCGNITPAGLSYTPVIGYSGPDSFKVVVSDGFLTDTATVIITVIALPSGGSITGSGSLCLGTPNIYTESVNGGVWSLTNGNATLVPHGLDSVTISGVTNGIDTLKYQVISVAGCVNYANRVIVINPYVSAITGVSSTSICTGQAYTLKDSVTGGVWNSTDTTIATISSTGSLLTLTPGTTTIGYTLTVCGATVNTLLPLTVNPTPDAGTISGSTTICLGSTSTLTETATGVWSISNNNASVSGGVVTANASGLDTLVYTVTVGICTATTTANIVVAPYAGTISGSGVACNGGAPTTLTESVPGGSWYSTNSSCATINALTGVIIAHAPGNDTIYYVVSTSCSPTPDTAIKIINVNPTLPVIGTIDGPDSVCIGSIIKLTDPSINGTWSTSAATVFNISKITGTDSAKVTGLSNGAATVSYTVTTNGCPSSQTKLVTVKPLPTVTPISGNVNLCVGSSTDTLVNATAGGAWSSNNTTIANVVSNPTGDSAAIIGGVSGTTVISYTITNSCGSASVTKTVNVHALPDAGNITGPSEVCKGATISLTETIPGGTWYHGGSHIGVSILGVLTGVLSGYDTAIYRVNTTYCGADSAFFPVYVKPVPNKGSIFGLSSVCTGTSITLKDTTYIGTPVWSSSNNTLASVTSPSDSLGIVNGLAAGNDTIKIVVTNDCGVDSAIKVLSVRLSPFAGPIFGDTIVCKGSSITLGDTTANFTVTSWSKSNSNALVTTLGVVLGNTPGIDTIMFKVTSPSCGYYITSHQVEVLPVPNAPAISGKSAICSGATDTLTCAGTGGTSSWVSIHPSNASVNSNGIVHGGLPGIDSVLYIVTTQYCGSDTAYKKITINKLPFAGTITGNDTVVCVGAKDTLINPIFGCVWSAFNHHARVDTTIIPGVSVGVVTGLSAGVDTIQYLSTTATCGSAKALFIVTVNPLADAGVLSGPASICQHTQINFVDTVTGGHWFVLNSKAIVSDSGLVTTDSVGLDTVIYTKSNSCNIDTALKSFSISPAPNAGIITGLSKVCKGQKITLTDSLAGGNWSHTTTNTSVSGGIVTAVNAGLDTIRYRVFNGCGADTAIKAVVINPLPTAPNISTHSPSKVCLNTMYQNFGADTVEPIGQTYTWSVKNAELYATTKAPNRQYCLVNFTSPFATGGVYSSVKLTSMINATGCISSDSIKVLISTDSVKTTSIIYSNPEFFCLDNSASTYQWGYDDVKTKDSTLLHGEIGQNYYCTNPDINNRNYWVITTYAKSCFQKTYFNLPTGATSINSVGEVGLELYPNPANTYFTLKVTGENNYDDFGVRLFDITGKLLLEQPIKTNEQDIQVSDLKAGMYLVSLTRNGLTVITKRIVKN